MHCYPSACKLTLNCNAKQRKAWLKSGPRVCSPRVKRSSDVCSFAFLPGTLPLFTQMEDCELLEGTKLHTKGRVVKSPCIQVDGDVYSFQGGRSTGIVKFLEPLSPLLNYFEV